MSTIKNNTISGIGITLGAKGIQGLKKLSPILFFPALKWRVLSILGGKTNTQKLAKEVINETPQGDNGKYQNIGERFYDRLLKKDPVESPENFDRFTKSKEKYHSLLIDEGELITQTDGSLRIEIKELAYEVVTNQNSKELEGDFPVDFDHNNRIDTFINNKNQIETASVKANLETGFGKKMLNGKKRWFRVTEVEPGLLVAYLGQIVKVGNKHIEIGKNPDGIWYATGGYSPNDFVYEEKPPYGLSNDQIPEGVDLEIFGRTYEYEPEG